MIYTVRCRSVMESGEVLVTHTEMDSSIWSTAREVAKASLSDGVRWLAEEHNEAPVGEIEFIVMGPGSPAREIERGTL